VTQFLEHHGVKGQKWGIRNKRVSTTAGHKKPPSIDARRAAELRQRPLSSLSNQQLRTVNDRMNLEQNYSRLNPTKIQSGKRKAGELLATAGLGVTAYSIITGPAGKALANLGRKHVKQLKLF
jgi:hypothetical protein